jgi:hypothetical protein
MTTYWPEEAARNRPIRDFEGFSEISIKMIDNLSRKE